MKKNVKEIAKSVLSATDPNIGLDIEEARKCIEEIALRAQESTAAGRLTDVFLIANPTGEVKVQVDPSQLKVNEGPQHELLTTSMMDEVKAQFDPKDIANIPSDHGTMDNEMRVQQNFRRLERNWRELRDTNIDLSRIINNPIADLIANDGGRDEHHTELAVLTTLTIGRFIVVVLEQDPLESRSRFRSTILSKQRR